MASKDDHYLVRVLLWAGMECLAASCRLYLRVTKEGSGWHAQRVVHNDAVCRLRLRVLNGPLPCL